MVAMLLLSLHPAGSTIQDDLVPLPTPATWHTWSNWSWEVSIVVPLLVLLIWYVIGAVRRGSQPKLARQHAAFAAGWISLALALVSPLHRLGDVLFSAHMLQHEILLLIAAPLMAAARPGVTLLYALRTDSRQPVGSAIARLERHPIIAILLSPLAAFLVHALALWAWHIPFLYQATLDSDLIHASQHLSFFLSGVIFWSALYGAGRSTMTYGAGVLYVFGTAVHCSALGALLTFSWTLWYPAYASRTELWHLSPIEDQQLGGLLMWIPSGVVFIVIGVIMFARWLITSDQRLAHGTLSDLVVGGEDRL